MTLKKTIALILVVAFSVITVGATKDKRTAGQVESVMKRMKKPEKEMEKLARANLYTNSKFATNAQMLAREAKNMVKIKHADKKFNDLNKEMVEYTGKLLAAIKKKDFKEIKEFYEDVRSICYDCHDVYKDL
ncbi:MAG: cytochrome c [Lentisphaeraceae bacterium]|nr:cytochrome c [Lentisphaeraceae bacterium]